MDYNKNLFHPKDATYLLINRFKGYRHLILVYWIFVPILLIGCVNPGRDKANISAQKISYNATNAIPFTSSQLDSIVQVYVESNFGKPTDFNKPEYVGMSIALFYDGKDHYYNYGETLLASNKLPNEFTLYEIGSITKAFTSLILAHAVVNRRLNLESHVSQYLPDSVAANPSLRPITVKMLANHTSGLPRKQSNLLPNNGNPLQQYEKHIERDLFSYLRSYKSTHSYGESFQYSNVGYNLLGVILEKVYGKSYNRLLKEYITVPLMLNQTAVGFNTMNVNMATGYDSNTDAVEFWKQPLEGAGSIISSSSDLLQFGKHQLPSFKSSLSKAVELTHQPTFSSGVDKVGLAWLYLPNIKDVICHSGATAGCSSTILINLKESIVIVILANKIVPVKQLGSELMDTLN